MRHVQSDSLPAASGRECNSGPVNPQAGEAIVRSRHKKACLPLSALLAGLILAVPGNSARAAGQTAILDYICATYESARQVALEQGWKRPGSLPSDCRTLFRRGYEGRIAEIAQIIEVVRIGDGRWVEIGRVHRGFAESGYSAGIVKQLFLY